MESRKRKRPSQKLWWAVSLALIAAGILGIVFVPRTQPKGPTLTSSLGVVSLPSSGDRHTVADDDDHRRRDAGGVDSVNHHDPEESAGVQFRRHGRALDHDRDGHPACRRTPRRRHPPTSRSRYLDRARRISQFRIIGVSVPLSVLTLNKNGTVNVPTNFKEPGWYDGDRSPGQKGSAVILGHVDNFHGPAVFFYLDKLKLGNRVDVTLADGRHLVFAVIGERMYKKTNFPDALVYGARSYPALQLVTCGGIFDPEYWPLPLEHRRLHRAHQVVATSDRTRDSRPRRRRHLHATTRISDVFLLKRTVASTSRQTLRKSKSSGRENAISDGTLVLPRIHARALLRTL